jgi:HK97 family phage major capsid protein
MNYQELIAKQNELKTKAQSFIKTMENENRDLNETENAEFNTVNDELKAINSKLEKYAQIGANSRVVDPGYVAGSNDEEKSFYAFLKAAKNNVTKAGNTLSEIPVPSTYVNQLFAVQPGKAIIADAAYIVPQTDLGTTNLSTVEASAGGYFGGVTVTLNAGENFTKDGEGAGIGKVALTPKKNVAVSVQSNDIFRASNDISTQLLDNFRRAIFNEEDKSYLKNSVSGASTPIFGCDGEKVITRDTAGAIGLTDIMNMMACMVPGLDGYRWVMSPSALAQVMNITNGTNGPRIIDLATKTIFGIPYFVSEVAASAGTANDVNLICPQYYAIKRAAQVYINVIPAAGDQTRFELISYSFGAPLVDDVVTLDNNDEVSPFIVLGAAAPTGG